MNIWQKLKKEKGDKPIMVLAPMADVTDPAFRLIIAKYGKPDVMWTEFVSADGLFLGGYDALIKDLRFDDSERPIIAQFFTSKPEMMEKAGRLAKELGFDGVDINMGCPDRSVEKQGAGASLIKNPNLAKELILSAKAGAGDLPVSVKTRIGYNKNELDKWLPNLLEVNPSLITIHARTRKEMSLVPARWERIKESVDIRNEIQKDQKDKTLIFGNGDVLDLDHGYKLAGETSADGVMLGRAIFGNPFLFSSLNLENKNVPNECEGQSLIKQKGSELASEGQGSIKNYEVSLGYTRDKIIAKLEVMILHTEAFEKLCSHKSFAVMKKHYKAYVNGFDGAKELRMKLMETQSALEVKKIVEEFLNNY